MPFQRRLQDDVSGWRKPTAPLRYPSDAERWAAEVTRLYQHDPDMEVEEYEELLDLALRGVRPEHPDLPARLGEPGVLLPPGWKLERL